jgi:Flp pilus assembly protein TadD
MEEYQRASLFFEAGDPAEAARIVKPIVDAEPRNSEVRLLLARAYYASAQLARAEVELRTLVDRDPSDHYAHHVLGRTLERQSRPREALPHLRLAAAMSPTRDYAEAVRRVAAQVKPRRHP